MPTPESPRRSVVGIFAALALIWGLSFLFIKVADEVLDPVEVALGRCLFGAAALLVILAVRRERLPADRGLWAHLFGVAVLFNSAPFTLFAFGEQRVSSILAGIFNATTPLFTGVFVLAALRSERPTPRRAGGLTVGFLGVLVVLGVWRGLAGSALTGSLACLGAAACYGLGFVWVRRFVTPRGASGVGIATVQVLWACVQLAVVAPFVAAAPSHLPGRVIAAVAVLGALGTGVAYALSNLLIARAGATLASTVTYLTPLVSTVAGVVALHETLHWNAPVGALVVVGGVVLAALPAGARLRSTRPSAARPRPGSPVPPPPPRQDVRALAGTAEGLAGEAGPGPVRRRRPARDPRR